jgi:cytochrome c-type biogenesis protein CcmE
VNRYKFALGALVVAAGLVYLFVTGFQQSAAAHMNLQTLLETASRGQLDGQRIQLGGSTVVPGSIHWDEYRSRPEFTITDGERSLNVRYTGHGVLPDTFKDQALVVLEGEYDPATRVFAAQVIFAKCPSKYEGQDYEGHIQAVKGRENQG